MSAPYFLSSDPGPVIRLKLNDWVNIIADASKPTTLSTSITVGTGQKTITVPADRAFGPGQSIRIARTSDPTNVWMQGTVISYSGTSLIVQVSSTSGSGTYSDWTITLAGGIGPSGDDGWTAQWRVAIDGERRVWEIYDWFGGTGEKPPTGYVSESGVTSNISLAVDVRGPQGAKGDAGPANALSIGTVQSGASANATITGTAPSQVLNLTLPKGDAGENGTDGWTPVFAVVADDERRVWEITDWTGGTGTKPPTGYVGSTGIVSDIADALDVRGAPGAGAVSSVNSIDPDSSGNVNLGISDIPGLEDALDNAGKVKTVANKGPDGSGNVALDKGDVGLGNVDNTSDADKPVSTATASALANKVDKVAGKGLSSEDFTTELKDKLNGIAAEATKNSSDAHLLNRANHTGTQAASTITGLAAVAISGSYNDLDDKPTIPQAPVNADWNATSGLAQILNKPELGALAAKNSVGVADIDATGTPSSVTYLRGDGTWETPAGGSAAQVGDIIQTLDFDRPDLAPPLWLPCNGSAYLSSAYPDLSELLAGTGPIGIVGAISDSGVPSGYYPITMASNGDKIIIGYRQDPNSYGTRVSTNGGATWSDLDVGGGLLSIAHAGSGRWFAIVRSGNNYIGRASLTTNGSTWTNNSLGLPSGHEPQVVVSDGFGNVMVLGWDGASVICTRSTDSGASWSNGTFPDIEFSDLRLFSLGLQTFGVVMETEGEGETKVFITEDVGSSWFALNIPENHAIYNGARLYNAWVFAAYDLQSEHYKILITRDKGSSWEDLIESIGLNYVSSLWNLDDLLVIHGSDGVWEGLAVLDQDRTMFTTPKIPHGFVYTGVSS